MLASKFINKHQPLIVMFVVVLAIISAAIETDIFVPSFPAMQDYFATTTTKIQMILTVNFIGLCLASFFCGPLSDSFGRRPVLLAGLTLFMLSSIGATLSTNIETLLFWRFIQGIGTSVAWVVPAAIIYDIYSKEQAVKILGLYNCLITFTLAFAPVLGSYLQITFGWQANFIVVAILACLTWLLVFVGYQESLPAAKRNPLNSANILKGYRTLLCHYKTLSYLLIIFAVAGAYMVFVANLSLIFIDNIGISEKNYGFYQAAVLFTFAITSIFSGAIAKRLSHSLTLLSGKLLSFAGACALLMVAFTVPNNAFLIIAAISVFTVGFAMIINIVFIQYMGEFPDIKGIAASLLTGGRLLFLALAISVASKLYNGTIVPVALLVFAFSAIATVLLLILLRYEKQEKNVDKIEQKAAQMS